MFWGVTIESGKRYSQVVDNSFHLSMAALESATREIKKPNGCVSVMIDHGNAEFLLCTLEHGKIMQVALDLLFVEGEEVTFFLNGEGTVHLTGYVTNDADDDIESVASEEEMASDLSVEDEQERNWPAKNVKKRKPSLSMEQINAQKKQRKELASPKSPKPNSPKKSPKVDIVDLPSSAQKLAASKSPFANTSKEQKIKPEKKSPQSSAKFGQKNSVEESDDESSDASEEEWEDADSDEDDEGQSNEKSSSDDEDDGNEGESNSFVPKLKNAQSHRDSIGITKNKIDNKHKMTPLGKVEKGDGDATNRSFLGKQNQDQKSGLSKKDSINKQNSQDASPKTPKMKLQGGIEADDLRVGNGPIAKPGKHVHVYYVGKLANNKEFDSVTKGKPFSFKLGKGEVIKGWDVAIQGMKVGGKRKITIPAHMGYGNKAQGPIPANSTLHFEVELKAVS